MQIPDLLSHLSTTLPLIRPGNGYQTGLGLNVKYGIDVLAWQGDFEIQWIDEISRPSEQIGVSIVEVIIDAIGYCDRETALTTGEKMRQDLQLALESVTCLAGGKQTIEKKYEQGSEFGAVQVRFTILYQVK